MLQNKQLYKHLSCRSRSMLRNEQILINEHYFLDSNASKLGLHHS